MIEEIKYFFLGLIQGLAEFFPISSSGHIILFSSVLDVAEEHPLLLSIIVHFATTLSTILIYRNRLKNLLLGCCKYNNKQHIEFICKLLLSSIPIIIVGILFRERIDFIFDDATKIVCIMLILTGLILMITNMFKIQKNEITFSHAFIIGIAQAVAILPGISRSGLTIATALFLKIKRKDAADFSFLMVLAPIIGITLIEIYLLTTMPIDTQIINKKGLLIAFFSSFFSGLFACKYMIKIVQKNNLKYFGYYCIAVGVLAWFLIIK
tara:strand:- start:1520 stop:2317 length:798 start_codon:yes stop_codon:yes gene_type:complete